MSEFIKEFFKHIIDIDNKVDEFIKHAKVVNLPSYAFLNWGQYLKAQGFEKEWKEKLETASLMANPTPQVFLKLATDAYRNKDDESFKKNVLCALKQDSTNGTAYCLLAIYHADCGEYKKAERMFKKADKFTPLNWAILKNWAICLAKQGLRTRAKLKFQKALVCVDFDAETMYLYSALLSEMEDYEEAVIILNQLLAKESEHFLALNLLALCYFKLQKYDETISCSKRALLLNNQKVDVYLLLAVSYIQNNDRKSALAVYEKAISLGVQTPQLLCSYALELTNFLQVQQAIIYFEKALELDPECNQALFHLGLNYQLVQRPYDARGVLEKYVERNMGNYEGWYNLGCVNYNLKEFSKALKCFLETIKLEPKCKIAYKYIAECFFILGENDKAASYYLKAQEAEPNEVISYVRYAYVMLEMKNYQEALRKIRKAFMLQQDNLDIISLYGYIAFLCDDKNFALQKFEFALSLNKDFQKAKVGKALILLFSNNNDAINFILENNIYEEEMGAFLAQAISLYTKLALEMPSDYNIGVVIALCDKVLQIYPEYNWMRGKRQELEKLITERF